MESKKVLFLTQVRFQSVTSVIRFFCCSLTYRLQLLNTRENKHTKNGHII